MLSAWVFLLFAVLLEYLRQLFLEFFLLILFLDLCLRHSCCVKWRPCLRTSGKFHPCLPHLRLVQLSFVKWFLSADGHSRLLNERWLADELANINHPCLSRALKFSTVHIVWLWWKWCLILQFHRRLICSIGNLIFNKVEILIDLLRVCHWDLICDFWFPSVMIGFGKGSHVISAVEILVGFYALMHLVYTNELLFASVLGFWDHSSVLTHFFLSVVVGVVRILFSLWLLYDRILLKELGICSAAFGWWCSI